MHFLSFGLLAYVLPLTPVVAGLSSDSHADNASSEANGLGDLVVLEPALPVPSALGDLVVLEPALPVPSTVGDLVVLEPALPVPSTLGDLVVLEPPLPDSSTSEDLAANDSMAFWMEKIKHQGRAPFHANPNYTVFRNVKDFGARGDGISDDTDAINLAMSSGDRCGNGTCGSSTISPAIVYFPRGTYLISSPINTYYYTQLIGNARDHPTLLAASNFSGMAVIDADPYIPGGDGRQWFINQCNFFRSVRNFIIDLRRTPASSKTTGIHWQVGQATSLMNIVFEMSRESGTAHQGIWMENGSGGYMGDMVINGGKFGIWGGNQQFTVRNVTFNDVKTAVFGTWNWGWTWQGININNCQIGFHLSQPGVGGEAIVDAVVKNTPTFIYNSAANSSLRSSLVLNNIRLQNVTTTVSANASGVVLSGGTRTITSWAQGNVYMGLNSTNRFVQTGIVGAYKPAVLLDSQGRVFGRRQPQYEDLSPEDFISVRDFGATGDGYTDDTDALQKALNQAVNEKVVFVDAGVYIVTRTLEIPAGSRLVGEAWPVIAGRGSAFSDHKAPQVVIRVGKEGSQGVAEITDITFSTVGPSAGAIVVEWNVRDASGQPGSAGMWNSHIRLGGVAGSKHGHAECPPGGNQDDCAVAFLALHLTHHSSAYLEGTWVWLADHDMDGDGKLGQTSLYSGRGILSESQGPVWMIGTASEHHVLYQYNLHNARNHYMGLIQTETPYFQPVPIAPAPFSIDPKYHDPDFSLTESAWALWVKQSKSITVFGAGLYNFFNNYKKSCIKAKNCQTHMVHVDSDSTVRIYSLATVGITFMVSVDGQGVANHMDNKSGFEQMATAWLPGARKTPKVHRMAKVNRRARERRRQIGN